MSEFKRILVVDNDEPIRTLFGVVLRRAGYHVDFCTNGREALAALAIAAPYDLLLIDLMMSPGTGFDVIRWLETAECAPRCVVASAGSPAQLTRAESPTVCAILQKPVDIRVLTRVISICLSSERGFRMDHAAQSSTDQARLAGD